MEEIAAKSPANTSCLVRPPIHSSLEPAPESPSWSIRGRLTFDNCQSTPTRATELGGVSNFSRLERFALAPKSVGLLRVWIWPCTRAAVASVEPQRVPANALHRAALWPSALTLHCRGFRSRAGDFKTPEDPQELRRVAFRYERFDSFGASQFLHGSCQVRGKHH